MTDNNFVWTDLSTFDLEVAKTFYSNVFGWEYFGNGEGYFMAMASNQEASGLYETPEKFRQMNMPSFWMSYIQVENLEQTVKKAKESGGIIELVDTEQQIGKIALIRDPSGAGFTVYEGNQLNARTQNTIGTMVWNDLFVSDASLVIDFYKHIFDWQIVESDYERYLIYNSNQENISAIQQISNEIKGKHEYWAVYFAVANLEETKQKVIANNGKVIYEDSNSVLLGDPFDAMFQVIIV